MEAFIRFKKPKMSFLSLVRPDFNVLPLIQPHFKRRYQDQRWLIYDEQRKFEFIMIYGKYMKFHSKLLKLTVI